MRFRTNTHRLGEKGVCLKENAPEQALLIYLYFTDSHLTMSLLSYVLIRVLLVVIIWNYWSTHCTSAAESLIRRKLIPKHLSQSKFQKVQRFFFGLWMWNNVWIRHFRPLILRNCRHSHAAMGLQVALISDMGHMCKYCSSLIGSIIIQEVAWITFHFCLWA